jgi:hypothetical protein
MRALLSAKLRRPRFPGAVTRSTTIADSRGQSLVEFTMVFPIMLLLLLTVADFGRVFASSIALESAARAAAETAAGDYLVELRLMPLSAPPLTPDGYDRVHRAAWQSICDEASNQPNATRGSGGGQCDGLPTVVCVHDGADPNCGVVYNAGGSGTTGCPLVAAGASNTQTDPSPIGTKYVEVRVCYRFSAFFGVNIPFLGGNLSPLAGNFYLERSRTFTVADY